jgi:serine/threonine protein kinase
MAKFALIQFPELADFRSVVFDDCLSARPLVRSLFMSDYILEQSDRLHCHHGNSVIGYGGSSIVSSRHFPDGNGQFAVKQFSRDGFDAQQLMREVETLTKLNHPCILRILNFLLPFNSEPAEIHTEYATNGSLDRVLNLVRHGKTPSFWTPTGIGIIICGIVLGMRFMHSHGFIHQDLKPSNILLNADGRALIGDFGTSRCETVDHTPTPETGTLRYAAPELFEEDGRTEKVDVFSFGLILYEILVGRAVFADDLRPMEIIRLHRKGERPIIPDKVTPAMKTLIERCWSPDPENRPSFKDILDSIDSNDFRIVLEGDEKIVRMYVRGVRDWEQMYDLKNRPTDSQ